MLMLVVVATTGIAQQFEVGLSMGSTQYTTTDSRSKYYNTFVSHDVDFGFTLSLPIGNSSFFFQPELNFTRRSVETSIGNINNVRAYNEALEIPLLFSFRKKASNENLSFYGSIGPGFSIVYKQRLLAPTGATLPPSQETSYSLGDLYKIGAAGELGIRWERSEKRAFTIGIRSRYEINSMTKSNTIHDFKFRTFTLRQAIS